MLFDIVAIILLILITMILTRLVIVITKKTINLVKKINTKVGVYFEKRNKNK